MVDTLILLYEETEEEFQTNGIGSLPDAISCEISEERNGPYELTMEYPVEGLRYLELKLRRILLSKPNPYDREQPFRIYNISKPINGVVTICAEHISYDLSGNVVEPFEADSVESAFYKMKDKSSTPCKFDFWTSKTTKAKLKVKKPISIRSLLGGTQGSILDIYGGGDYEFDRFQVKLRQKRGEDRGVTIRYGKNLTDMEQEENCASVYTGVFPYWCSEENEIVILPERIIKANGAYSFERIMALDLSQDWEQKPSEEKLREHAEKYIKKNNIGIPKVSIKVSFAQIAQSEEYKHLSILEQVNLCDMVQVSFEKIGVNAKAKCVKTIYNVLTNKYTSIELGDSRTDLSKTIHDQQKEIEEVKNTDALMAAIENATKMVSGGAGGYVVIQNSQGGKKPDEILIMDKDNVSTARNVWRWNKGGLGFSSNGYEGPFKTAITADGRIVADFITAGQIDGALIKAGTITSNLINIEYTDSISKKINNKVDGVKIYLNTRIQNTADRITLETKKLTGRTEVLEGKIETAFDKIKLAVTKDTMGSYMEQYYNKVIWGFNHSSKYVQINAGSLDIYDGQKTESRKRSSFDENGIHFWRDGYYVGKIGTNRYKGKEYVKGLSFDLEYDARYMGWGAMEEKNGDGYTSVMTYYRDSSIEPQGEGIYFAKNIYGNGYKLSDVEIGKIYSGGYKAYSGQQKYVTGIDSDGSYNWRTLEIINGIIISA